MRSGALAPLPAQSDEESHPPVRSLSAWRSRWARVEHPRRSVCQAKAAAAMNGTPDVLNTAGKFLHQLRTVEAQDVPPALLQKVVPSIVLPSLPWVRVPGVAITLDVDIP